MDLGRTWWWQERVEEETVYFMVDRNQRVRKGLGIRNNLQRHVLHDYFFQLDPKVITTSQNIALTGDQSLNT
jgi:hypothetical protein